MALEPTSEYTPAEQLQATATARNRISIGLPRCITPRERRFPLTPEATQILTDGGFTIRIEAGAGDSIHYTDAQYTRAGAEISSREETLQCDIVMHLAPITLLDIRRMRRGAMLLTFSTSAISEPPALREMLRQGITTLAIDLIEDVKGNTPFADILNEIDGRAALAIASSLLADSVHGKGILLGGVAGVVPCEVLVIGSNDTAAAAARSALGLGAIVRVMDNDVYRLRRMSAELQPGVVCTTLHPRGLAKALASADVVVYTDLDTQMHFDLDTVDTMKRGVITFDLSTQSGGAFPSMPAVNLADTSTAQLGPTRVCYINAGSAVPRTAAMAMSNTFITMLNDITQCLSALNALKLLPGLQAAALTFAGKAVNRDAAEAAGVKYSNLQLYLALS